MIDLDALDFAKSGGMITVVTQDARSGQVLMVAHADREALERTVATGEMHYRSRTRGLWHKGATSGNVQRVVSLTPDCDADAILARVVPAGPACHTGARTCFGADAAETFGILDATIGERANAMNTGNTANTSASGAVGAAPSYTQRLLADRNLRLKKLGEEAIELATACVDGDRARAAEEAADLIYHTLVALRAVGGSLDDVRAVLDARAQGGR